MGSQPLLSSYRFLEDLSVGDGKPRAASPLHILELRYFLRQALYEGKISILFMIWKARQRSV